MPSVPAPLLDPTLVDQARRVAESVRNGEIAPLVGAGFSIDSGLPSWDSLIRRAVLAWQLQDSGPIAQSASGERYYSLFRTGLGTDLAIVSFIRAQLQETGGDLADLVKIALYMDEHQNFFVPRPLDTHRHLVALCAPHSNKFWTTNYDDLLEQAAGDADIPVRALHPADRLECKKILISHLHGFLPPTDSGETEHQAHQIVLAEDDYHLVAGNTVGWTNREFHRLFDGYRALILGMSLTDPNLRRVLRATTRDSKTTCNGSIPRHFALMQCLSSGDCQDKVFEAAPPQPSELTDVSEWRRQYWQQHDVELIELPTYDSILPFLLRVRYESFGDSSGDLWKSAADACSTANPWKEAHQTHAQVRLQSGIDSLCSDFSVAREEIVEMGMFLVTPDATEVELVFRSGDRQVVKGGRKFSIVPDAPTGVAGRVFVTGDLVRISRESEIYDYGLNDASDSSTSQFVGLISVPIVDWMREGIPLGVLYVTTTTIEGRLFELKEDIPAGGAERGLRDLYVWLQKFGLGVLNSLLL